MVSEKISVIIPVYNTEKYVEKSVRSVMDQTYRNLEIICVNDGSTDGSAEILYRLQQEDPRIVIIEKDNGGLGDARNCGLRRATSEWISFLDSDDTISPNTYETVSRAFQEAPDMISYGTRVVLEEGAVSSVADRKYYSVNYSGLVELNDEVIKRTDVSVWNKLFRKSILDRFDIHFEKIYYEDFPFTLQYLFSVKKVYYLQDQLYNYLRRSGSIMAETFNTTPRAIDHLYAADYLYAYLAKHDLIKQHEQILSGMFNDCYWFSIKYTVLEKRQEVVDLAGRIYERYRFLNNYLIRKCMNGTVFYMKRKRRHVITAILQFLFSARWEFIDYKRYKVVRLFNIIIYKKPLAED